MKECSAATGIPVSLLSQIKAMGCSAFRYNRVFLGPLLKEYGSRLMLRQEGDQQELPLLGPRAELDRIRAEREKIKLLKDSEQVIEKQVVVEGLHSGVSELKGAMERSFLSELPPALVGLRETPIRDRLRTEIEAFFETMRQKFEKMVGEGEK